MQPKIYFGEFPELLELLQDRSMLWQNFLVLPLAHGDLFPFLSPDCTLPASAKEKKKPCTEGSTETILPLGVMLLRSYMLCLEDSCIMNPLKARNLIFIIAVLLPIPALFLLLIEVFGLAPDSDPNVVWYFWSARPSDTDCNTIGIMWFLSH